MQLSLSLHSKNKYYQFHYKNNLKDTEFPGVVARPVDSFRHWLGYGYRLVADNVNMLKLIQLGLTFYNEKR